MSMGLSGVFTGIDSDSLIRATLQAEQTRMRRYADRRDEWQQKIDAVKDIEKRFSDLKSLVERLGDADELRATTAESSNAQVATISSGPGAAEGTHTIEVNQVASTEKQVHAGLAERTTLVGAGKFVYTYNGTTREIGTTDETTLADLVSLINNDADNPGVSASILEHEVDADHKYHLVLTGEDPGSNYDITTEAATTLADFDPASFEVTQAASDAQIRVDGYPPTGWISKSSNTITDIIPGATVTLQSAGTASVTLRRDTGKLKSDLKSLASVYNGIVKKIEEYAGYDEATGVGGVLQGDSSLNGLLARVRSVLTAPAPGFADGQDSFTLASQLGFELDKNGRLEFDAATFDAAISEDYYDVLSLIGAVGSGATSNTDFQFSNALDTTEPGTYEVQATFDADGQLSGAKIRASGETTWRDAVVDAASGEITGAADTPEEGLVVGVVNPSTSTTVSFDVRVQQGFAGRMVDRMEEMLSDSGPFQVKTDHYENAIERINRQIERQEDRLVQKEQRLREKYARLEATLAQMDQMKQSMSALAQTVAANTKK